MVLITIKITMIIKKKLNPVKIYDNFKEDRVKLRQG